MSKLVAEAPYNALVIKHFERPRNVRADAGSAVASDGSTLLSGEGGNLDSGIWIEFQCDVMQRKVRRAWFRAYGCPHTLALASWLTDRLVGETLSERYTLDRDEIKQVLDLPTEKLRSLLVAEDAIRACAQQLDAKEAE